MDKKKIQKIILIIIVSIFFIFGCFAIYKFTIINKIFNKMKEYISKNNYRITITYSDDENNKMEIYYKDGIGKFLTSTGVYTWTDGKEAYVVDDENKEYYNESLESSILISNEAIASMIPGYSKTILQRFFLAGDFKTSVKLKNYDEIKFYVIETNEDKKEKRVWFKEDTLLPSQISVKLGNFEQTYYYNIKFNVVTSEDVKKPNLDEYKLIEK